MWLINKLKWRIYPHFFFFLGFSRLRPLFPFFSPFLRLFLFPLSFPYSSSSSSFLLLFFPIFFLFTPTPHRYHVSMLPPSQPRHLRRCTVIAPPLCKWNVTNVDGFFFSIQLTTQDVDVGIPDTQTHSATSHQPPPSSKNPIRSPDDAKPLPKITLVQTPPNWDPQPPRRLM